MKRVAFSNAFNADFKEEKHKRDKDGKFSKSGSGGSSSKSKGGASSKKEAKTEPSKAIPPISDDVSLDHINSLMEYTGNSFSVNDGLRKGKLSEKDKKVSSVTKKGGETYVTVDLVKAQPAPKSEPKGSPPEPVSKVYRKQVETLIKSDAKKRRHWNPCTQNFCLLKLLKSSLSSRVK